MWIRSQDKLELVDVRRIIVFKCSDKRYRIVNQYRCTEDSDDYDILGEYNTEQRAIEILHEIQRQLVIGTEYDDITAGIRYIHQRVFNMPEK